MQGIYIVVLLTFFITVYSQQTEFCVPPTWNASLEAEEISKFGENEVVHYTLLGSVYYDAVEFRAFKANYLFLPINVNVTVLELYDQLLEFQWTDGVCEVAKIPPEIRFSNCFRLETPPVGPIYFGGLAVNIYTFPEPDYEELIVTKGSYIPVEQRLYSGDDVAYVAVFNKLFNLETAPHFDKSVFTPPSYCQVVEGAQLHHRVNVRHTRIPSSSLVRKAKSM